MYRNQKIILLHSEEEGKLPENLELGELAVNCAKNKEFICLKNTDNQLVKITPNGGGGNSKEKQPFKLLPEIDNAIVSESNESNQSQTLTHGLNMRNNSELSFAFGYNRIQILPISINGTKLKLNREIAEPVCDGYYDGAIIIDENGNHISDIVSYTYENDGYELDIEVTKEFDFKDGPKYMLLRSCEGGSNNFNFGQNNHLDGSNLGVFGNYNFVNSSNNYVFGNSNIGYGLNNIIFGNKNHTAGQFSILQGEKNSTTGTNNLVFGIYNDISGSYGIYAGQHLEGGGNISSILGQYNDASENYTLSIGNGFEISDVENKRHNSFTINDLGEIMFQEDVAKEENGEIKYPPMISLQSLVARIKALEEELNKLKNK